MRLISAAGGGLVALVLALPAALAGHPVGNAASRQPETLAGAVAAAEAQSCADCVGPNTSAGSARRGLAELTITDPSGGGYVGLWGYTGSRWLEFAGYQDTVPYPNSLPARIWICTDANRTNVRSGPGVKYRVVRKVTRPARVRANKVRVTTASKGTRHGVAWYRVSVAGTSGWVASFRVANSEGCGFWKQYWDADWTSHANS